MNKTVGIAIGISIAVAVGIILMSSSMPDNQEPSTGLTDKTSEASAPLQESKIQVLASFYPYYEFAKNVAGDSATVMQYLPSGIEAHDWEPRPQEIQLLKEADVFVYNGLGMESYVDNIINSGEFDNVKFVTASKGIDLIKPTDEHDDEHTDEHAKEFAEEIEKAIEEFEHGHIDESQVLASIEEILHEHEGDGHDHGNKTIEKIEDILHEIEEGHMISEEGIEEMHHVIMGIKGDEHGDEDKHHGHDYDFDPHIWLDPILVKHQVNNIRDGLIEADPQNKMQYEQNAKIYNEKLDMLDTQIRSSLASCAKDTFVPFHNAFAYLGERYDIKVKSLSGLAPDSEASAAEIAEFVDFVKEHDIKVIFAEELVDPRLAKVIADEADAKVLVFSPIEALSPEEIGTDITYIDKMEQNLNALKIALECQ